jgi:hypothetical protein
MTLITVDCAGETFMAWVKLPEPPMSAHIRAFIVQTWFLLYADLGRIASA